MSAPQARLEAYAGRVAVRNAKQRWTRREGRLLRLEAGGHVGLGEVSPLPGYSPDALPDAEAALVALDLGGLDDALAGGLDDALAFADAAWGDAAAGTDAPPSAACALEMALLDLWSRQRGEAAWRGLARLAGRPGSSPVPLAALVDLGQGMETARRIADERVRAGYRTLKAKVGRDPAGEALALAALREDHPEVALRVDANGTLDPAGAGPLLAALRELGVELLEEPYAPDALAGAAPLPVPVALDESLQGPTGPARLVALADAGRVQAMVLKPMALGGLRRALELARLRPLPTVVSHLFDGPVAWAAYAALALALGEERLAAGLAPHAGLDAWPPWPVP
ncbi:MAG: enolase C-terminal domain-like protein, partial [Myxococcota bacterium]